MKMWAPRKGLGSDFTVEGIVHEREVLEGLNLTESKREPAREIETSQVNRNKCVCESHKKCHSNYMDYVHSSKPNH